MLPIACDSLCLCIHVSSRLLLTVYSLAVGLVARCCLPREVCKCSSALLLWRESWAAASTRPPASFLSTQPAPFWHLSACSQQGLPGPGGPWAGWCPLSSTTLRPEAPARPSPSASTSSSPLSLARPTSPCSASKFHLLMLCLHRTLPLQCICLLHQPLCNCNRLFHALSLQKLLL